MGLVPDHRVQPINMKYFIGYLIQGEMATWHINLAKSISEKFNTWKLHEKLPPHITIFYPFNTDNIDIIKNLLVSWTKNKKAPGRFVISDFDHFDDKVVFAKVEADLSIRELVEGLRRNLKEIPGMPEDGFSVWHPHATLANRLSSQEINQIWNYVLTLKKPNFIVPFDNVTIFRGEPNLFEGESKWVIEKSFKFN